MSSFGVKLILRRDVITLNKRFSESKEICEYLIFRGDHRMSYVHLPVENLDQKRSPRGEIPIISCMAGHLFVYMSNNDIIMQECLCDCEECLCLNLLSSVKNTSKLIENKNNDTNDSEHCL